MVELMPRRLLWLVIPALLLMANDCLGHHESHGSDVVVAANPLSATFNRQEHWIDEVLLHDGRTVDAARTVTWTTSLKGEISQMKPWPNQYTLTTTNPDTGKTVRWAGEPDFVPRVLDFWEKVPYPVVGADSVFSDLKQYGCPEIPYVFFRYDERARRWTQVAAREFPRNLLTANLSSFEGRFTEGGRRQSKEDIAFRNRGTWSGIDGRVIPIDFASWQNPHKNQYRVGRYHDGCRHTVPSNEDPSHPQSPGQPSQKASLEILDVTEYDPVRVLTGDVWNATAWDKEKNARCGALLKKVRDSSDTPELRGWLLFVNDASERKKARDTGHMFCNAESVWFVDYVAERGRVVVTKFSIGGDFIYRMSFERPIESSDYRGGIRQPSFRDENGFLLFDWTMGRQAGPSDWHLKRIMKVRVREP